MNRTLTLIFMAVLSVIFGYFLIGKNLQAKFYYIDDHEIPYYLNSNNFNDALHKTEFYTFGKGARFRPAYAVLRVTETFLWGMNPYLWYLARFVMFSVSVTLAWILLKKYIGLVPGMLLVLYTLTATYWIDIWTRLGPGEIYCVPAFMIFLWSFINIFEQKRPHWSSWALLTLSSAVMVGSKETFAFILLFIFFLDGYLIRNRRLSRTGFVFSLLAIISICYVIGGIALYTHFSGVDFYLNSTGILPRLYVVSNNLIAHGTKYLLPGLAILFSGLWVLYKHKQFMIFVWIAAGMAATVLSQIYFYNGDWPTYKRYDFPGMLVVPIAIVCIYVFTRKLLPLLHMQRVSPLTPYLLGGILLVKIIHIGYAPIIKVSESNVARTNEFMIRLAQISHDLQTNRDIPIVYESCSGGDFEFITSLNRFLAKQLKGRTLFLKFNQNENKITAGVDIYTAEALKQRSVNGDTIFRPLSEFQPNECYSVNFSCPASSCAKSASLVQPWCISKGNPEYLSPYRTKLPNSDCIL